MTILLMNVKIFARFPKYLVYNIISLQYSKKAILPFTFSSLAFELPMPLSLRISSLPIAITYVCSTPLELKSLVSFCRLKFSKYRGTKNNLWRYIEFEKLVFFFNKKKNWIHLKNTYLPCMEGGEVVDVIKSAETRYDFLYRKYRSTKGSRFCHNQISRAINFHRFYDGRRKTTLGEGWKKGWSKEDRVERLK